MSDVASGWRPGSRANCCPASRSESCLSTSSSQERWGRLAGEAIAAKSPLPVIDGLLAATALQYNLTFVTRNTKRCLDDLACPRINPWTNRRAPRDPSSASAPLDNCALHRHTIHINQGEIFHGKLFRTSNPALSGDTFRTGEAALGESMTVSGTVNKAGLLLICCVATAAWTWNRFFGAPAFARRRDASGRAPGCRRHRRIHPRDGHHLQERMGRITAPLYALLEGLVLGGISAMVEMRYHGIAIQAVGLTFGTLSLCCSPIAPA